MRIVAAVFIGIFLFFSAHAVHASTANQEALSVKVSMLTQIVATLLEALDKQGIDTSKGKLHECPDLLIKNLSARPTDSRYYMLEGKRRELSVFDPRWVFANCKTPIKLVS